MIPGPAQPVLEAGSFCSVAVQTASGPHCTPMVFAMSGGRLWVTTSRGSVKARAWQADGRISGLVRHDGRCVMFSGSVRTYDALDAGTWRASLLDAPALTRASVRFTAKNARFFAGYAFDARAVPFAWTPPGRVFVGVDLDRVAVVGDDGGLIAAAGSWARGSSSRPSYRSAGRGADPLAGLPGEVGARLGRKGFGALAVEGGDGIVVLPAAWLAGDHQLAAAVPGSAMMLAATGAQERAALSVDRASWWRARDMVGAMVQADAESFQLARLSSGAKSAASLVRATGVDPDGAVLVRLRPRRLVWWLGWSSGAVTPA